MTFSYYGHTQDGLVNERLRFYFVPEPNTSEQSHLIDPLNIRNSFFGLNPSMIWADGLLQELYASEYANTEPVLRNQTNTILNTVRGSIAVFLYDDRQPLNSYASQTWINCTDATGFITPCVCLDENDDYFATVHLGGTRMMLVGRDSVEHFFLTALSNARQEQAGPVINRTLINPVDHPRYPNYGQSNNTIASYYIYRGLEPREGRRLIASGDPQVFMQNRSGGRYYRFLPQYAPVTRVDTVEINGVAVPVHHSTAQERNKISEALALVPNAHIREFVTRRNLFSLVNYVGSSYHTQRLYGSGNNTNREDHQDGEIMEDGLRIELSHSIFDSLYVVDYKLTILHELGHVAYEAGLIPRSVQRTYGTSVHSGPSESPAYAYAYYYLEKAGLVEERLTPQDRAAFRSMLETE